MMTDSLKEDFVHSPTDNLDCIIGNYEVTDTSSDAESEISISEKIVLESNEKRLRQRMTSLQTSIMGLKEQLKLEKQLWKEDMEKIRTLQKQQQEVKCNCCLMQPKSKELVKVENSSSNFSLASYETNNQQLKYQDDLLKKHSIKQLLELQNYKRKLAETENMCNLELTRVKQSLEDLKALQTIASEWGKNEAEAEIKSNDLEHVQEIYVKNYAAKSE